MSWISVDRSTLETISQPADEYVELFCEKLELLLSHSFVATQQASFCKSTLQPGKLLVTADFSENYAFILQDAAQGCHWNNSQATIHPFVAYYIHVDSGELCHLSYVVISDCLRHYTVAVYLFQKRLITYLKRFPSYLRKVYRTASLLCPRPLFFGRNYCIGLFYLHCTPPPRGPLEPVCCTAVMHVYACCKCRRVVFVYQVYRK